MIDAVRKIYDEKKAAVVDGVLVDLDTASAIVTVFDVFTDEHKEQFSEYDIKTQAAIAFKLLAKYGMGTN